MARRMGVTGRDGWAWLDLGRRVRADGWAWPYKTVGCGWTQVGLTRQMVGEACRVGVAIPAWGVDRWAWRFKHCSVSSSRHAHPTLQGAPLNSPPAPLRF